MKEYGLRGKLLSISAAARTVFTVLFVLAPYIFATSPTPAPYKQFSAVGHITRANSQRLENFSVVLFAKRSSSPLGFQVLAGIRESHERAVSLTDSTGAFAVTVCTREQIDSVAVGIITPDRPVIVGTALSVNSITPFEQTETFTTYNDATCAGCTSPVDKTSTVIVAYLYHLPDQVVAVSW